MLHVSIFVELLRSQPRLLIALAALAQTLLWWLVPALFYAAPPGNLPEVLAVGHEFQLGSHWGPPLAFWFAEIAYDIGGAPGVYLLAQICVLVTYWAVFALGRAMLGVQHAAMTVLLMVGITAFTVPSPEFGPPLLAMPYSALAILHFWRALGEGRRSYWLVLALDLGLLLLTSYAGAILFALIILFTASTARGWAALRSPEPWIAGIMIAVVLFPHLIWLHASGGGVSAPVTALLDSVATADAGRLIEGGRELTVLLLAHAGSLVMIALATGWRLRREDKVPIIQCGEIDPFARRFVYFFALASPAVAWLLVVASGAPLSLGSLAPHVVLSTLAFVMAAGRTIAIRRQGLTSLAWGILLIAPPVFAAAAIIILPWTAAIDLPTSEPARAMGRFFGESFERRTGKPPAIVTGDPRTAMLVALGASARPSLYLYAKPERTPWVGAEDIRRKGAIIVWPTSDTAGLPPPDIKARFPELVPEVPRAFDRMVQGRLPLLRIGWGMLRPQTAQAPQ